MDSVGKLEEVAGQVSCGREGGDEYSEHAEGEKCVDVLEPYAGCARFTCALCEEEHVGGVSRLHPELWP